MCHSRHHWLSFIPFALVSLGCLIGALVLGLARTVTWVWWVLLIGFFVCGLSSVCVIMYLFPKRKVPETRGLFDTLVTERGRYAPLGTLEPDPVFVTEVPRQAQ
jgi:bacteriorhodopsin